MAYNKDRYKEYRKRETSKLQRHVYKYLKEHPCVDCGESNPIKLEFDHIKGTKRCHPSQLMYLRTLAAWEKEIANCEVVCANCHRVRTMKRGNWYRYRLWTEDQGLVKD